MQSLEVMDEFFSLSTKYSGVDSRDIPLEDISKVNNLSVELGNVFDTYRGNEDFRETMDTYLESYFSNYFLNIFWNIVTSCKPKKEGIAIFGSRGVLFSQRSL